MKDQKDDKTLDLVEPTPSETDIDVADMDALEAALDNRMEWQSAVELVQEALIEWAEEQNDLASLCTDKEDALSIIRLAEETLKAWKRILQG